MFEKDLSKYFSGRCDFIAPTGKFRQVGALVKNFRSLHQPEKNLSVRPSVFSGRCDEIVPTGKIRQVGALVKNFRSLHQPEKNLSVRPSDFFCLSYRGQVCGQRGSSPLSVRLLRRQNFGSPLAKFMIFGFVGNDLANDLAVTPANFSLPRQKYSTTKK